MNKKKIFKISYIKQIAILKKIYSIIIRIYKYIIFKVKSFRIKIFNKMSLSDQI